MHKKAGRVQKAAETERGSNISNINVKRLNGRSISLDAKDTTIALDPILVNCSVLEVLFLKV